MSGVSGWDLGRMQRFWICESGEGEVVLGELSFQEARLSSSMSFTRNT
jgi:hypothetical protein